MDEEFKTFLAKMGITVSEYKGGSLEAKAKLVETFEKSKPQEIMTDYVTKKEHDELKVKLDEQKVKLDEHDELKVKFDEQKVKFDEQKVELDEQKVKLDEQKVKLDEQIVKFEDLKSDFLTSQTIDWKDIGSGCISLFGTIVGLGCMAAKDNDNAVYIGGIASTAVGVVSGAYSTGTMIRKRTSSAKVHKL